MNRRILLSILVLLSFTTTAAGCAAPATLSEDDVSSSEDAVRTAKCPGSIAVDVSALSMRTFFAELGAPADYNAMKATAADLAARGTIHFEGSLSEKKSGRCTYGSGASTAALYTKGGKDIVRLTTSAAGRDVYVYTYPKTWTPELSYTRSSSARVVTAIAPDIDPADDVDASEAPAPFWVTLGSGRAAKGFASQAADGITLANGADETVEDGPNSLRIIVPAGTASATVSDSSLANCEAKKNAALSNTTRTVFDLSLEYESDDGWNGCTFDFSASGYHATLSAGFSIDD
jgi:hypothetical protein